MVKKIILYSLGLLFLVIGSFIPLSNLGINRKVNSDEKISLSSTEERVEHLNKIYYSLNEPLKEKENCFNNFTYQISKIETINSFEYDSSLQSVVKMSFDDGKCFGEVNGSVKVNSFYSGRNDSLNYSINAQIYIDEEKTLIKLIDFTYFYVRDEAKLMNIASLNEQLGINVFNQWIEYNVLRYTVVIDIINELFVLDNSIFDFLYETINETEDSINSYFDKIINTYFLKNEYINELSNEIMGNVKTNIGSCYFTLKNNGDFNINYLINSKYKNYLDSNVKMTVELDAYFENINSTKFKEIKNYITKEEIEKGE